MSKFCAIATTSTVSATSSDGSTWEGGTLPLSSSWVSVAWKSGTFCAIAGSSLNAATSPDGVTWTSQTLSSSRNWQHISSNGSVFCAVSLSSSVCATSPDGVTWTDRNMPSSKGWIGLEWNGSVFCAVSTSTSNSAATSPDGVTWTAQTLPSSANWQKIAWNGSVFCTFSFNSTLAATSPDGVTWTSQTLPASRKWRDIAWNGSVFCIIASDSNVAATSPDGVTWTENSLPQTDTWHRIAWNGNVFCAIASNSLGSTVAATSPDGVTWTAQTLPSSSYWIDITAADAGPPVIVGDIPVSASVSSAMHKRQSYAITGSTPVDLAVASAMNLQGTFMFEGSVPVSMSVAGTTLKRHRSIIGNISVTTAVASTMQQQNIFRTSLDFVDISLDITTGWRVDSIELFDISFISSTLIHQSNTIAFGFIDTTLEAHTGFNISGDFIELSLSSTGTLLETMTVDASFIESTLSASVNVSERITASIGFISSTLTSHGGASVAFGMPEFTLSSSVTVDSNRINASVSFIDSSLSATATYHASITASFGFIDTYLSYFSISCAGPQFSLAASMSYSVDNAVSYVLNVHTGESTRYTNYPFSHIITIGGRYYGVKSDGLYLLEGDTDIDTEINGTILTKESDHGSSRSKRLQYVYLNSDTATTITPYFDGAEKNSHASAFGGRKTKMSLGNAGRYIQLKIENIGKLYGMEILPADRQQRVK